MIAVYCLGSSLEPFWERMIGRGEPAVMSVCWDFHAEADPSLPASEKHA